MCCYAMIRSVFFAPSTDIDLKKNSFLQGFRALQVFYALFRRENGKFLLTVSLDGMEKTQGF